METAVRDGVALRYERREGPRTPLVFVHGWCCDHTYFAPQVEHFAALGHTVVAVDLRGHGASDQPEQEYSMAVFADDLAWLAGELGIGHPVFIGHSMGGVIVFSLAIRHPELPSAIVMIDSPVVRPAASKAAMPAFIESLQGPDYQSAIAGYIDRVLFLPTDDAVRKAQITAAMPATARHVMVAALEGMKAFVPDEAIGRVRAPSLYLAADETPLSDLPRLKELVPSLSFGQTVGSGHFCQLEVPEQVNPMIERFLAVAQSLGPA